MTCIVATPDFIAADSREVAALSYTAPKLFRFGPSIYGIAGSSWMGAKFMQWVEAGKTKESEPDFSGLESDDDFHCLELHDLGGLFRWDKHLARWPINEPQWIGIGSGHQLAIGALEAGATIHEAFDIAFRRCGSCGPPIVIMYRLYPPPTEPNFGTVRKKKVYRIYPPPTEPNFGTVRKKKGAK